MATRDEIDTKDRADRALRGGRAREALGLYATLLAKVSVFEPGLYESWLEGALAAYQTLGRHGEAARVLAEAGHPALAAVELETAGAHTAARLEWERVVRDPRLAGIPYETALAHFNLGEALLRTYERTA